MAIPLMTLLYLVASIGLLFLSGYGVTRLCLREDVGGLRWALIPGVGLATWVLLVENLGFLGLTTRLGAPLALCLLAALAVGVRLVKGPAQERAANTSRWMWGVAGLCAALVLWPMLLLSHRDYIGFANPDAVLYFSLAEYFQEHGYWHFPYPSEELRYHPILVVAKWAQAIHRRVGEVYWISSVASLLAVPPKEALAIVHATAYFLVPVSVYAMGRMAFRLDNQQALLAMAAQGVSAVLGLIYFQQQIPHIMGLAVLPLLLGVAAHLLRVPTAGPAILLGLLLASLFAIYPEMFPFGVIPLVALLFSAWRRDDRRTILRMAAVVVASSLALNPVYWTLGIDWLTRQASSTASGGATHFYAFSPIMLPIYWGLSSRSLAYTGVLSPWVHAGYHLTIFPLAAALIGVAVSGARWLLKSGRPAYGAYLAAYLIAGLTLVLVKRGYTYGFFKFLSFTHFLILTSLAVGLLQTWREPGKYLRQRIRRILAVSLGVTYMGLNGLSLSVFGWAAADLARPLGLRNVAAFPKNHSFQELSTIRDIVGTNDSVLVNIVSLVPHVYIISYLKDVRISFPQSVLYLPKLDQGSARHQSVSPDRYVLEGHGPAADIVRNDVLAPIWKNDAFALSPLAKPLVSLQLPVAKRTSEPSWYDRETEGRSGQPFRWVNNDATIRVLGEAGMRMILVVDLEPAAWVNSGQRTIDVYVDDELLQTVKVAGRTRVVTDPWILPSDSAIIRLRAREASQPLRRTRRLMRFLLGEFTDYRMLNFRVFEIGVLPASVDAPEKVQNKNGLDVHALRPAGPWKP